MKLLVIFASYLILASAKLVDPDRAHSDEADSREERSVKSDDSVAENDRVTLTDEREARYYYNPNLANQDSISQSGHGGVSISSGEATAEGDYYGPYYGEYLGDFGDYQDQGFYPPGYYGQQSNTANQHSHSTSGNQGVSISSGKAHAKGGQRYGRKRREVNRNDELHSSEEVKEKGERAGRRYYYGQNNQANQQSLSNSGDFGHSTSTGQANAGGRYPGRRPGYPGRRPGFQNNLSNQQSIANSGYGGTSQAGGSSNAGGW